MKVVRSFVLAKRSMLLISISSLLSLQPVSGNIFVTVKECKDDKTFLVKNEEGKDCTWLSQKRKGKKNKLCQDSNVSTSCPVTCGTCMNTSSCKDDETFLVKNKEGKGCKWLSQKRMGKRKKLCNDPNVSSSCPVTCDTCSNISSINNVETECPADMSSPVFKESCENYKDGLTCDYNYIYTGCTWGSIKCTPSQVFECSHSAGTWVRASMMPTPCQNPSQGLPLYQQCEPCPTVEPADKCPAEEPGNGSPCSEAGLQCDYDFIFTGCSTEELRCTPISFYFCMDEGSWQLAQAGMVPCPETLPFP